ncbi:ABC transporter permease [Euzebya sp.]|uniref:ABC transporter permease n=1 Tax=Euzebya sp. TaxID=1971409 RepID=UPI00351804FD
MTTPTARAHRPSPVDAARDAATFVGRGVRHSLRSVDALLVAVMLPVCILVLFVYVFGGAIRTDGAYVDYVVPGIVLLCAAFGSAGTAVGVTQDLTTGIIDRFRSMPITASAVLAGHVVASVLRNLVSTAIVVAVALLIGFRPTAGVGAWTAAIGLLALFMAAIATLAAAFGLVARDPEAASAFSFAAMFLPYVSSAFVPPETMPAALQAFAEHQPTTPIIETLRALLLGTGVDAGTAVIAVAWCTGLGALGLLLCVVLFRRATTR